MTCYYINCGPSWFLCQFASDDDAIWETLKTEGATSLQRVREGGNRDTVWVRGLGIANE